MTVDAGQYANGEHRAEVQRERKTPSRPKQQQAKGGCARINMFMDRSDSDAARMPLD